MVGCKQPYYRRKYQQCSNLSEVKCTWNQLIALCSSHHECADVSKVAEEEANCCEDSPDCNVEEENNKTTFVFAGSLDVEVLSERPFSIPNVLFKNLSLFIFASREIHSLWLLTWLYNLPFLTCPNNNWKQMMMNNLCDNLKKVLSYNCWLAINIFISMFNPQRKAKVADIYMEEKAFQLHLDKVKNIRQSYSLTARRHQD